MKALTVCQPYAHLIWLGEKPIENRNWPTKYRGPLLIHAGKSRTWMDDGDEQRYPNMQFGAFIAVAQLVGTPELDRLSDWREEWRHLRDHEHANGPFCWILEDVRRIKPVPCRGAQGLWVPPNLELVPAA